MISLIIPIFNEETIIQELYESVRKNMDGLGKEYEVLLVDDGSTDNSLRKLLAIHADDPRVKVIQLSRNFGHQAAYTAGLEIATGDFVIMMDGDLQDPPELIPVMYKKITENNLDVVSALRTGRKEGVLKVSLIKVFHRVFSLLSSQSVPRNVGNFSIMNQQALKALLRINERRRYLPGLRSFIGFKHGTVEYIRPNRHGGKAKMNFMRLTSLALDAIFSFTNIPIRICLVLGGFGIVFFLVGGVIVFVKKMTGAAILGWTSIVLSIYFLGSVQLFFLGILGEYVFRIYEEALKRPLFIVKKIYERTPQNDSHLPAEK